MSAVELRDITKTFDASVVVDHLSLSLPEGSMTVLVGPSGCGKSTTLRIVAGLESADSGTVTASPSTGTDTVARMSRLEAATSTAYSPPSTTQRPTRMSQYARSSRRTVSTTSRASPGSSAMVVICPTAA